MPIRGELAGLSVGDGFPVRIVGIINTGPESFYKGSIKVKEEEILETAVAMEEAGADIIDIGAMSTAPYLETQIPLEEEARRLVRAVKAVAGVLQVPISADTQRAGVAEEAIGAGARIINDVSGFKEDPMMAGLVAEMGVSAILVAREQRPGRGDPLDRIIQALRESLELGLEAGIPRRKMVVDPGIGFFRETGLPWYIWDSRVLRGLRRLEALGQPIHVGVSRKSFIGVLLDQPDPADRLEGSLASAAIAVLNGAHLLRTHDVAETIPFVRIAERIRSL